MILRIIQLQVMRRAYIARGMWHHANVCTRLIRQERAAC